MEDTKALLEEAQRIQLLKEAQAIQLSAIDSHHNEIDYNQKPNSLTDNATTFGRSALEGATMGISEPVVSGLKSTYETARNKDSDLRQNYINDVKAREQSKQENPMSDLSGKVLGGFASGALVPETMLPFKLGAAISSKIPTMAEGTGVMSKIVPIGVNTARKAFVGTLEGGLGGGISQTIPYGVKKITGFDEDQNPLESAQTGAIVGGSIGGILGLGEAGGRFISKVARTATNLDMADLRNYAVNFKKINLGNPESIHFEQVKDGIDNLISKLRTDAEQSKIDYTDASKALDEVTSHLDDMSSHPVIKEQLQRVKEAQNAFDNAAKMKVQQMRETDAPLHLTDQVRQSMKQLHDDVVQSSSEGYDILDKYKGKISVKAEVNKPLKEMMDSLLVNGKFPTAGAEQEYNAIDAQRRRLKGLGKIDFQEVKRTLQLLDKESAKAYSNNPAEFNNISLDAIKKARGILNESLGQMVPEYAEHMAENVAPKTRMLNEMDGLFTGKDHPQTVSTIANSILKTKDPKNQYVLDYFKKLGDATGVDYISELQPYINAKQTLGKQSLITAEQQKLPELQVLNQEIGKEGELRRKLYDELRQKQNVAADRLIFTNEQQVQADRRFDPVKNWNESNSEAKLKTLQGKVNSPEEGFYNKQITQHLEENGAPNLTSDLQALRTRQQINKDNPAGSKWVVGGINTFGPAMGAMGAGLGASGGGVAAGIGSAIGWGAGILAQKYGGKATAEIYRSLENGKIQQALALAKEKVSPEDYNNFKNALIMGFSKMPKKQEQGTSEAITDRYISPDQAGKAMLGK